MSRFVLISDYFVKDKLTGYTYTEKDEIVALLNQVNDRADRNAEIVMELHNELGAIDSKIKELFPSKK